MSKNYEQLEIDTTLEIDRNLKDNVQTVIRFALSQMMEEDHPEKIRNRHEGYGIVAEKYSSLNLAKKIADADMKAMLSLLPNGEGDILNVSGSLFNSAAEIAVAAIKLAAQCQRILNDLYYGEEKTPIEKYIKEQGKEKMEEDGFEETETTEAEEE